MFCSYSFECEMRNWWRCNFFDCKVLKKSGRDHFWAFLFVDQFTGQTRQSSESEPSVSFCSFFKTPKLSIEIKYAIINTCLKELRCRLCENTHVLHHPGKSWLLVKPYSLQWNSYYKHFIAPKLTSCDHWKCCSNDYHGTAYSKNV